MQLDYDTGHRLKRIRFYLFNFIPFKVLWTQKLTPYFKLFVALAILEGEKDHMVSHNYGFNEILKVCPKTLCYLICLNFALVQSSRLYF